MPGTGSNTVRTLCHFVFHYRHRHVSSLQLKVLVLLLLVVLPKGQRSGVSLSKKLGPCHCECGRC